MSSILGHDLAGHGEPLLILNGGMMSIAAWEPIAAPLRKRYQVLRCDFRGQLFSPGEPHRDMAGNVRDLMALLDHSGIDRVHVLGASFGAEAGLLLAATAPERVRSLTAVTATDYVTDAMRAAGDLLREVIAGILTEGGDKGRFHDLLVQGVFSTDWAAAHARELAARRRQIAQIPDPWFESLLGVIECFEALDLRLHLASIRCPTLVVVAGDDQVMPVERSRALAAAIAGAKIVEHAQSGHALVAEQPRWLVARCLEFLERREA
ncbi:MAG: alpha/beta hydrolase [bacterium]|nr:alpha/beta hydrolase [bacterium]